MGQCAKGAMGGSVAVAADNCHAGQGPTLLRADYVHNALAHVIHRVIDKPEFARVGVQSFHLDAAFLVFNALQTVQGCGHVVIGHSDGFFWRAHRPAIHPQSLKGLGAGHLMDQMAVDIEQAGAIFGFMGDMRVPDFIIECFRGHVRRSFCCSSNVSCLAEGISREDAAVGWILPHQRSAKAGALYRRYQRPYSCSCR